ncbi:MAG: hypothetical protein ACK5SQ_10450 [Chitinophagales bacterium]
MEQLATEECELPLILNRFWEIGCNAWQRTSRLLGVYFLKSYQQ